MTDMEQRVEQLEARVEALEDALTSDTPTGMLGVDRYDSAVLDKLAEADGSVSISQLHTWYRRAGVRSEQKIKTRLRDLRADGLIEHIGTSSWRYTGPRQETLEGTA